MSNYCGYFFMKYTPYLYVSIVFSKSSEQGIPVFIIPSTFLRVRQNLITLLYHLKFFFGSFNVILIFIWVVLQGLKLSTKKSIKRNGFIIIRNIFKPFFCMPSSAHPGRRLERLQGSRSGISSLDSSDYNPNKF